MADAATIAAALNAQAIENLDGKLAFVEFCPTNPFAPSHWRR